jgi:hypothetical protein
MVDYFRIVAQKNNPNPELISRCLIVIIDEPIPEVRF